MKKILFLIGLFFLTIYSFGQIKVTSGNVNFRTSPEIKENIICIIPIGTEVTLVLDTVKYENWSKITYVGKTGYVNNVLLKNSFSNSKNPESNSRPVNNDIKYYKNSKGDMVQSPTYYKSTPAGATAECNDGTFSFSQSRRGTCSHHGGVKRWLK